MSRHPNQQIRTKGSVEEQAMHNPKLMRKLKEGRKRAKADAQSVEAWAGNDFQSSPLTPGVHYDSLEIDEEET